MVTRENESNKKETNPLYQEDSSPNNNDDLNLSEYSKFHFNFDNNIEDIKQVINRAPELKINLLSSHSTQKCVPENIDPFGLKSSLRYPKDGYTYFGYVNSRNSTLNIKLDFLINPLEGDENEERFIGQHFYIRFNPYDLSYYIKDLGQGYGTFMKLTKEIKLVNDLLINIGESYLVSSCEGDDINDIITIKIFNRNGNYNPVILNHILKKKFYLGRCTECDGVIDDPLLSSIHCTMYYKDNEGWFLKDGKDTSSEKEESKQSTNGTWVFISEEEKIYDKMQFKENKNLFECLYVYNPIIN
jgi:hypothetical protein